MAPSIIQEVCEVAEGLLDEDIPISGDPVVQLRHYSVGV